MDNDAHRGGGIYIENNFRPVTIRRIHVEGNEAHQGAGVYSRGTMLSLTNSVIINNEAGDVGGGFFTHPSSQYPWTKPCPCPPIDPPAEISFTTFHGNIADSGAQAWFGAPNWTFRNNILTGHTATAVQVKEIIPDPMSMEPTPPTPRPIWRYNDTFPATFQNMSNPTGSNGNLEGDPHFMDTTMSDFHLAADSMCRDAGEPGMLDLDGTPADLGAYGGPNAP
jgi:hypothetical protein